MMLFHGGELSLAQAGGGPGLVRQVQPECDHEVHQQKYSRQIDKGRRGLEAHLLLISSYRRLGIKKMIRTGVDDDSRLFILTGEAEKCIAQINISIIISI
jgi:hypothetical protein